MKYTYIPTGICPTEINFEIEDDKLKKVEFDGGCDGNLQAISKLIKGMSISEIRERLSGIECGSKPTSCVDQLVKGIDEALGSK